MSRYFARLLAVTVLFLGLPLQPAAAEGPKVRLVTNFGPIVIELDPARAPKTVENFLAYVRSGHYQGTIFHRVWRGFMIQGGGFTPDFREKSTRGEIRNEADNGLKNLTGTVAMARRPDAHSASAQFFVNTVDNTMLDHRGKGSDDDWGYAVFGKVISGMDVVRRIEALPVSDVGPYEKVPQKDVIIEKAEIL